MRDWSTRRLNPRGIPAYAGISFLPVALTFLNEIVYGLPRGADFHIPRQPIEQWPQLAKKNPHASCELDDGFLVHGHGSSQAVFVDAYKIGLWPPGPVASRRE